MATPPDQRRPARFVRVLKVLASVPVTIATVTMLLVTGALTGTLFTAATEDDPTLQPLLFGLPAYRDGRLWTVFTGAVTFVEPEFYLFVGGLLAVGLGLYERRVGSLRAAIALLVTHTAGVVVPALLLWPVAGSDWRWAATLASQLDAGLSAGGIGVAAASTALLRPPWRGRIRVLFSACLAVLVLKSGLLWDLEHGTAWIAGLLLGPRLAGRKAGRPGRPSQAGARDVRVGTALLVGAFALASLVEALYPGIGGLVGPGFEAPRPLHGALLVALEIVIALMIAGALVQDRAPVWWVAVLGAGLVVINSLVNVPGSPRTGDAVCAGIVLAVLLVYRNSWPWRTDDGSTTRFFRRLLIAGGAFAAATAGAIWLTRQGYRPVPGPLDALLQTLSRFSFSRGNLVPVTDAADWVLRVSGVAWAIALIALLLWWLYLDGAPPLPRPRLRRFRRVT